MLLFIVALHISSKYTFLACINSSTAGERRRTAARGAGVPPSQRETEKNCGVECRRETSVMLKICHRKLNVFLWTDSTVVCLKYEQVI